MYSILCDDVLVRCTVGTLQLQRVKIPCLQIEQRDASCTVKILFIVALTVNPSESSLWLPN